MTCNHQLAHKLARSGIPVFPCLEADHGTRKTKAPYTGNGFKDATTDLNLIDWWWKCRPGAVVGLPTGDASGVSVIDGDIDRDTGEAVGEQQAGALGLADPHAVRVRTQSGGVQLLYRHVDGAACSAHKVASHVDTRGDGGYIIAPGSVMADGASYSYAGRSLSAALIANDLPDYPLEAVRKAIEAEEARKKGNYSKGRQSDDTAHAEGHTKATDTETIDVLRQLLAEAPNNLDRIDWVKLAMALRVDFDAALQGDFIGFSCRYSRGSPCTEKEAKHVWNSAANPGTVSSIAPALSLLRDAIGLDRYRAIWRNVLGKRDQWAGGLNFGSKTPEVSTPTDWPDPAPRFLVDELPDAPPLPLTEVFGPKLSEWVTTAAEGKGAPADYVVLSVLSVLSAAIGNSR